jgi:dTDP-4-dehydrorhamnose reductase
MIIILGGHGYVGRHFTSYLRSRQIKVMAVARAEIDYTTAEGLRRLLQEYRPDFLINAAGFTGKPNVDACETARAETLFGNTVLPLRIAEACAEAGIAWAHISSGCIYQGARGVDAGGNAIGFREEDTPNFSFPSGRCSYYSGTKALAEEFLIGHAPKLFIWRLRVPFHSRDDSRNYLSKILRYQRLLDVRNSLSHLDDFIAASWALVERREPYGIYNLTNPGSITTREIVDLIRHEGEERLARKDGFSAERMLKKFEFFASEEEFMQRAAVAPRSSCVLDTTKAEKLGLPLRPVREAVIDSLQRWRWETCA